MRSHPISQACCILPVSKGVHFWHPVIRPQISDWSHCSILRQVIHSWRPAVSFICSLIFYFTFFFCTVEIWGGGGLKSSSPSSCALTVNRSKEKKSSPQCFARRSWSDNASAPDSRSAHPHPFPPSPPPLTNTHTYCWNWLGLMARNKTNVLSQWSVKSRSESLWRDGGIGRIA